MSSEWLDEEWVKEFEERVKRVLRFAAAYGIPLTRYEAAIYAGYGPSAINALAEDYAERRWGKWARRYVEERGWVALEVLEVYEELERLAIRLGVEVEVEHLLDLAERYGELAPLVFRREAERRSPALP